MLHYFLCIWSWTLNSSLRNITCPYFWNYICRANAWSWSLIVASITATRNSLLRPVVLVHQRYLVRSSCSVLNLVACCWELSENWWTLWLHDLMFILSFFRLFWLVRHKRVQVFFNFVLHNYCSLYWLYICWLSVFCWADITSYKCVIIIDY